MVCVFVRFRMSGWVIVKEPVNIFRFKLKNDSQIQWESIGVCMIFARRRCVYFVEYERLSALVRSNSISKIAAHFEPPV